MLRPKEKRDNDYRHYAASVADNPGCAGRNGKSDSAVNENASIDEDDPKWMFSNTLPTRRKAAIRPSEASCREELDRVLLHHEIRRRR